MARPGLRLEVNGFSGLLFIAAGLLLLLSAPRHWAAKGVSLIVGIALGAIAVIAGVKDHGALGVFAANHLTEIVWGAAAVVLIGLSLLPRVGAKTKQRDYAPAQRHPERDEQPTSRRAYPEPPSTPQREHQTATREQRTAEREPVSTVDREPLTASTAPVERRSVPTNVGNGSERQRRPPTAHNISSRQRRQQRRAPSTALRSRTPTRARPTTSDSVRPHHQPKPRRTSMSDKHVDEAKGRVKEAAGSISGDQRLKNEGKDDQAKATVKDKTDKIVDQLTGRGRE